jgi:hypothetical protein
MAVSSQTVDTSSCELKVYAAFHESYLPDIQRSGEISPEDVMQATPSRSWVPLCCDRQEAVTRGLWGYNENSGLVCSPSSLVVAEIDFTAFGASYFLLNKTLTTRDKKRYRFHGKIPYRSVSHDGQVLLQVRDITTEPPHDVY